MVPPKCNAKSSHTENLSQGIIYQLKFLLGLESNGEEFVTEFNIISIYIFLLPSFSSSSLPFSRFESESDNQVSPDTALQAWDSRRISLNHSASIPLSISCFWERAATFWQFQWEVSAYFQSFLKTFCHFVNDIIVWNLWDNETMNIIPQYHLAQRLGNIWAFPLHRFCRGI